MIRRYTAQTSKGSPVEIEVHHFESILPSPFCSPWRHPIWWWKLRHLRADIKLLEAEVPPELSRRMRELEERAFIHGSIEP